MPSRGFAKLDAGIVDSSLWMKEHDALRVWIAMLAKSDSLGIVRAAVPALAHLCFVTVERFEEIIDDFSSPDKHSRTPDNNGIRINRIEGGWLILNYLRYRDMMQRKAMSHADRQKVYRAKVKKRDAIVTHTVTRDLEADTEAEGDVSKLAAREVLQSAQRNCQSELEAAGPILRMPLDVTLAKYSRTPGGQQISNIAGCGSTKWLETTTDRMRNARLAAIGDAIQPLQPNRRMTASEITLAAVRSLPDPEGS